MHLFEPDRPPRRVPSPPDPAAPAPERETWSVGELHAAARSALSRRFRGRLWVHGELRSLNRNRRSGHCYLTLADPHGGRRSGEATLDVAFWSDRWRDVTGELEAAGVAIEEGADLRVRGELTMWDQGRVMLVADRLDVEGLVGRLAAARARLVRKLVAEGLWERNRRLPTPALPLRVGLVAAAASDGYHDFVGRLLDSGYAFEVTLAAAAVQGGDAPRAISAALGRLGEHHRSAGLDVIVLVRGGGSRADLAAFDHEAVARAVATSPVPVWTGIGHTADSCLADDLAQRVLATPTAAAAALVDEVQAAHGAVAAGARRLVAATRGRLRESSLLLARSGIAVAAHGRRALDLASTGVRSRAAETERATSRALAGEHRILRRRTAAAASGSGHALGVAAAEVAGRRLVVAALDPRRVLERGFTLTRRSDGSVVHRAAETREGDMLVTEFADGRVDSRVERGVARP